MSLKMCFWETWLKGNALRTFIYKNKGISTNQPTNETKNLWRNDLFYIQRFIFFNQVEEVTGLVLNQYSGNTVS